MASDVQRYVALGHDFGLECDHPRLDRYLRGLLEPFARPGTPRSSYRLVADRTDPARVSLRFDGEMLVDAAAHAHAVGKLLWHLNVHTIEVSSDHVLFHSAVAEQDGRAVLLPAEMESGKTTLVAGLVRAGLRYLSDEIAAVDPETLRVDPYPKALSIDPGSWEVLADLRPRIPPGLDELLPRQWQVPATDIYPHALATGADPRLIVMPRYLRGHPTRLDRIQPIDAVPLLARCTFELARDPNRDLDVIVRLLRRAPCYELTYSSLTAACGEISDLLERQAAAVA